MQSQNRPVKSLTSLTPFVDLRHQSRTALARDGQSWRTPHEPNQSPARLCELIFSQLLPIVPDSDEGGARRIRKRGPATAILDSSQRVVPRLMVAAMGAGKPCADSCEGAMKAAVDELTELIVPVKQGHDSAGVVAGRYVGRPGGSVAHDPFHHPDASRCTSALRRLSDHQGSSCGCGRRGIVPRWPR